MESRVQKHSRRRYLAAAVPSEVRTSIARVADAYLAEGVSFKRQREIWCEAGYEISEPTFRRLRARVHEGHDPLSSDKRSGRPEALTDRQIMIFVGWVLNRNDAKLKAGVRECRRFIEDTFGFAVAQGTVHKYLMESGFSSRKGRRRTGGYKFDLDALIGLYEKDLERFWGLGIKDMLPQHVACMDSSSLGWRLLTRKTYSPKGGTQPKIREGNPAYTNLVVWATFPDGVNRCPALLFTGDPQFTERSRVRDRLDKLLTKYKIDPSRIVTVNEKKYVGESQATIQHFLKHYPALQKCLILSDAGGSYAKKRVDIVREWGADHATFTPAVHEYMSPLDNHAFGIAKAKMRSNRVDETDRLEPSLVFLNALDSIKPEQVRAMWDRNFLLQHDEIDREAVREILRPSGKNELKRSDYFAHCRDAYAMEVLGLDPEVTDQPPLALQDGLDGVYWK
jgi:transposase